MTTQSKEEALDLFEEHRAEYLVVARKAARALCVMNGSATVEDVRRVAPPPDGVSGKVMGAVFRHRDFAIQGYELAQRKTSHRRPLARFKLVEGPDRPY